MAAKKPVIGVCPLVDYQRESLWMLPGYFGGIMQAGGIPFMLPLTTDEDSLSQLLTSCDGILITGGQDVAGDVYGCTDAAQRELIGETSPARDTEERLLLKLAIERDMPVLGICRGIQIINALLGGTLYQDLPTQHPSEIDHHGKPPYDKPVHTVTVLPNTPLAACVGAGELAVNSYHHQAVHEVASSLKVMATSEDGLVEALYHPEMRYLWALQWHPELSYRTDEASRSIFKEFVDSTVRLELMWV